MGSLIAKSVSEKVKQRAVPRSAGQACLDAVAETRMSEALSAPQLPSVGWEEGRGCSSGMPAPVNGPGGTIQLSSHLLLPPSHCLH